MPPRRTVAGSVVREAPAVAIPVAADRRAQRLAMLRPQNLPDEWYGMWDGLMTDMRRESEALPMSTVMMLMEERIATLYVQVKMAENVNIVDQEALTSLQKLWVRICDLLATQLHRHSQTPEQRFVASFKAALNSALREAGPDCRLADFMPILANHMREFDL